MLLQDVGLEKQLYELRHFVKISDYIESLKA